MSPIAIFTYNRPDHLKHCIKSLKKNVLFKKTNFFIFQDALKIKDKEILGKYKVLYEGLPNNFTIIKRKKNYGLKKNIIDGISQILIKYKNIIVCEDDLVFHKNFIYYMNKMLIKYEKLENISSISGFSYVREHQLKNFPNEYLLSLTSSWGWATWGKYWKKFQKSNLTQKKKELFNNKKMQNRFDYDGAQSHTLWLKKNSLNKISSWNIEWEFFNFINSYFTLYPKKTFVENRGFDGSGVHCTKSNYKYQLINPKYTYYENKKNIIDNITEDHFLRAIIKQNIDEGRLKKTIKKLVYFNL